MTEYQRTNEFMNSLSEDLQSDPDTQLSDLHDALTDQEITKGLAALADLWKVAEQLKARGLFHEASHAMNWILSNLDTLKGNQ